ncbi:MAG: carboxy-S-adenosyl-L-methionine synthase CmoA [Armatimonadota bacterium]
MKDTVFAEDQQRTSDFEFDKTVSVAFDDMVGRSVPFYHEMQRMTGELAADFAVDGTNLYDLGCATATTFLDLDPIISPGVRFVGIDNSNEMLDQAKLKLKEHKFKRPHEFIVGDLNKGIHVENASVVIMILTLQFVRPLYREQVIQQVLNGMNDNGCLILIEKLIQHDSMFNRLFIKYYYDMKRRNGYSEMEISKKREALENVLIPYRMEENRELLLGQGFRYFEEFFRWYNFCGMVAVK